MILYKIFGTVLSFTVIRHIWDASVLPRNGLLCDREVLRLFSVSILCLVSVSLMKKALLYTKKG